MKQGIKHVYKTCVLGVKIKNVLRLYGGVIPDPLQNDIYFFNLYKKLKGGVSKYFVFWNLFFINTSLQVLKCYFQVNTRGKLQ